MFKRIAVVVDESLGALHALAKRGRADAKAVGRQMTKGSGGCWLRLTNEQYIKLLPRGRGDN